MKMTKENLKAFRADFKDAVKELEAKYGVKVTITNIHYSDNDFHTKMEVVNAVTDDGKKVDRDKVEFERDCIYFGLKKSDYLREVHLYGRNGTYILYGVKTNARKNNMKIRDQYGKAYVCPMEMIRDLF